MNKSLELLCILLVSYAFINIFQSKVFAQQNLFFSTFETKEHLSNGSVFAIHRDHAGFVWVGTQKGLNRFDGRSWISFLHDPNDSTTIHEDYIFSLSSPSNGDIWVGTNNGISVLDANSYLRKKLLIPSRSITGIESSKGFVTVLSVDQVIIYDENGENKREMQRFHPSTVNMILNATTILSRTDSSIQRYSIQQKDTSFIMLKTDEWKSSDSIDLSKAFGVLKESLVMLNIEQKLQLVRLLKGGKYQKVPLMSSTDLPLPHDSSYFRKYGVLPNGAFFYPQSSTIFYVQPREDSSFVFHSITSSEDKQYAFKAFTPFSPFVDRYGLVWIGDNTSGVTVFDSRQLIIKSLQWNVLLPNPPERTNAWGLDVDEEGKNIVFGTDEGAYSLRLSKPLWNMNPFDVFVHDVISIKRIGKQKIQGMTVDVIYRAPYFYINDRTRGVYKYDPSTEVVTLIPKSSGYQLYQGVLMDDVIYWSGLGKIFKHDNKEVFSQLVSKEDGKRLNKVVGIKVDREPTDLLLSSYTGTYRWNTRENSLETLMLNNETKQWFGNSVIMNAAITPKGYVLASFGNGLLFVEPSDTLAINTSDGLANPYIYDIVPQKSGWWFSTNAGHGFLPYESTRAISIDQRFGNPLEVNNQNGVYKGKKGWVGFSGFKGFSFVNETHFTSSYSSFREVQISSVRVQKDMRSNSIQEKYAVIDSLITIPFHSFLAELTPAIIDLYPERYRIQYRWEDTQWQDLSDETPTISLLKSTPGKHTLHLRNTNLLGEWSPTTKRITIFLTIPIWERTPVKATMVIFGILVVGFVGSFITKQAYRLRINRIEKERELLLERERLSKDLHDSIGTQLSLIMHHLDLKGEIIEPKVKAAREIASDSMQHLRETIWALKTEASDLETFGKRLERFIRKKLNGLSIKFDSKVKVSQSVILKPTEVIHVLRIVEEVVSNMIKYSKTKQFRMCLESDGVGWRLELEDFGIGFSQESEEQQESYGLIHLKQRAHEIGGILEIDSELGRGTKILMIVEHKH